MEQNYDLGHLVVSQHLFIYILEESVYLCMMSLHFYDVRSLKYLNIVCNNLLLYYMFSETLFQIDNDIRLEISRQNLIQIHIRMLTYE